VALAVGKKADNYCRGKQRPVVMGPGLRGDDNAEVGFLAAGVSRRDLMPINRE